VYKNDIKLSEYGESIIKNGEFVLTEDDSGFIIRMLLTTRGSWAFHPDLGVGLEEFMGEIANENLILKIKNKITSFFKLYGLFPMVSMYYLNEKTIISSMNFYILDELEPSSISFSFSLENGNVIFIKKDEANESEEGILETQKSKNKYTKRR